MYLGCRRCADSGVARSAFVEEASQWVIFPGEAPNTCLELLHANQWLGDHDSGASGRLKAQGTVEPDAQKPPGHRHSPCRTDVIPGKRPEADPAGGGSDTSFEESDLPDRRGEPQARHHETPRQQVREEVAGHIRIGAVRQNGRYRRNQCEQECEQNRRAKEWYLLAKNADSAALAPISSPSARAVAPARRLLGSPRVVDHETPGAVLLTT